MLRILGDVHGEHCQYLQVIHNAEHSVQVGDFGFEYKILDRVDPSKHVIILGNHDNHDYNSEYFVPNILPKFGVKVLGNYGFFHMQGAFSIDWRERVKYDALHGTKSWWPNEQLSYAELEQAVELYKQIKPDLVITHDAPRSVVKELFDSRIIKNFGYDPETFTTHTSEALQAMFEIHQPRFWYFGHYHKTIKREINGTTFQCLAELNYIDLP